MPIAKSKDFYTEINSFRTMNTRDNPVVMRDDEMPACINFMPIGTALYTVPGYSAIKGSTPVGTTILRMFSCNVAGVNYKIVATTDGAIYAFDATWARTLVKASGSFVDPRFGVWKNQYLLIVDKTYGYGSWNGTTYADIDKTTTGKKTHIAVWKGRVWLADTATIVGTAPDSYTDFTVGNGAFFVVDNYVSLMEKISGLISTQDYLYVVGDTSTHIISGLQVLSDGTTFFQITEALPGVGTLYSETIRVLGNTIFMMTGTGVKIAAAGSFEIISQYLDGLMFDIDFTFSPVAFFADFLNKKCYMVLVKVINKYSGRTEKWLLGYHESRWFAIVNGTFNSQPTDILTVWQHSDSTGSYPLAAYENNIVQLFDTTSTVSMTKKVRTKSFNFGSTSYDKQVIRMGVELAPSGLWSSDASVKMSVIADGTIAYEKTSTVPAPHATVINDNGGILSIQNDSLQTIYISYPGSNTFAYMEGGGRGKRISIDYQETGAAQYVLSSIMLEGQMGADW